MKKTTISTASAIALLMMAPLGAMAQAKTIEQHLSAPDVLMVIAISMLIFVALVFLYMLYALDKFLGALRKDSPAFSLSFIFNDFYSKMTDAVPVEKEADILMHHEYDGIRELDNRLPPWWVYMFYATCLFAVVYIGWYHVFDGGPLQAKEYENSIRIAAAKKEAQLKAGGSEATVDENTVEMLTDEVRLAAGKDIYSNFCGACHGKVGEGGVGPNLTDEYWMHGGTIKDVFKSVKYGIPQKGMIAWQNSLSPAQIQEVSSYILSLKGSNPPNAKEPQGEKAQEQ